MLVTLAEDRLLAPGLNHTLTGPTFGEVQGVAVAVGPQAEKVTVPVGDPLAAVPVTVAVSTAVLPKGMLGLLSAVVSPGMVVVLVTWRHSVAVLLSLTGA